jgi:hypothetical protein
MLKHNQVGSSEEYLQKLDWQARGLTMDTTVFPNVAGFFGRPQTHSRSRICERVWIRVLLRWERTVWICGIYMVRVGVCRLRRRRLWTRFSSKANSRGGVLVTSWLGKVCMITSLPKAPGIQQSSRILIEKDRGSTLRDMQDKRVSATECIPGRIQRSPQHNRTRTPALSPSLQHVILRFQPLGRRLADIAV